MATLNALSQFIADPERDGTYLIVTRCYRTGAASDTLTVPDGCVAAADLSASGAATVVVTNGTTLTVSGGVANAKLMLVSRHAGQNAAAIR